MKFKSWFWYGRFEGASGWYTPPDGWLAHRLYWLGNIYGRLFGPPSTREVA